MIENIKFMYTFPTSTFEVYYREIWEIIFNSYFIACVIIQLSLFNYSNGRKEKNTLVDPFIKGIGARWMQILSVKWWITKIRLWNLP